MTSSSEDKETSEDQTGGCTDYCANSFNGLCLAPFIQGGPGHEEVIKLLDHTKCR